ncbi:hypothetical protein LB557_30960, partial [Mesorhizobium sp. BR115XR7A]|uniref:hypothetical protein n=1 Tax=Mesorhizobium sp. BR115XR7A TaxID=2876645 RepID=UPI001CD04B5B
FELQTCAKTSGTGRCWCGQLVHSTPRKKAWALDRIKCAICTLDPLPTIRLGQAIVPAALEFITGTEERWRLILGASSLQSPFATLMTSANFRD